MLEDESIPVVYLGGFGRSGTTLLERVLGEVPGWSNVGELVDLARAVSVRDELCGCGENFSRCPVWTTVGDLAFGGWSRSGLDRLERLRRSVARQRNLPALLRGRGVGTSFQQDLVEFQADLTRVYHAFAEVTDSRVIVDASKGPAFGVAVAGSPGINLRMINLVRDPRGVAWSWSRHVARPQTNGDDEMWRISAPRAAGQWAALQVEMEAVARARGLPTARLRYEDFIADAKSALLDVSARLDLGLSLPDLAHIDGNTVELGASHGLSGNPGRFNVGSTNLKSDTGWRRRMPSSSRALVTAMTLPLLVAYGYPVSPAPVHERTGKS